MRLAILGSRGFPSTYGGYETLVRYFARHLVARGHDVTVYCRGRSETRRTWMTEGVQCVAMRGIDSTSLSTLSFGATSSVHAAFRQYDAALVLNVANGFYLPLLRMAGIPTVVNTDGVEWERGKWGPTAKRVFRLGARLTAAHASALVADSREMARIWQERFHVTSTFIPYGAPVLDAVGDERLEELGLVSGRYSLVVARLIPENNIELILDAHDPPDEALPKLVVVGTANQKSEIESRLRRLDDANQVRWVGHVSDQDLLIQLWAHCGVYLHGHSVGGTNPGLLQAMGAGAPVLALNTQFNREVLREEESLFPRDPAALRAKVLAVYGSTGRRVAMVKHAQAVVRSEYQWDQVCDAYLKALQAVAEGRAIASP